MSEKPALLRNVYIPILLLILNNAIGFLYELDVSLQLFISSTCCVYVGCVIASQVCKKGDGYIKVRSEEQESIGVKQAIRFPIVASVFLVGIYFIYKYADPKLVNLIMTILFCTLTGISNTQQIFTYFPFPRSFRKVMCSIPLPSLLQSTIGFAKIQISLGGIISFIISTLIIVAYGLTKHWLLNNLLGISVAILALKAINLQNFKTGFVLLWLLFFYDIFFVYGTDVMVEVAKKFDLPIKLLFPYINSEGEIKFSMLGLGDIVLPGIFVSLCLKFDVDRAISGKFGHFKSIFDFKLTYFNTCFIGYVVGILATYITMKIYQHPQPALLFLVPTCTLSVLFYSLINRQVKQLYIYEAQPLEKKIQGVEIPSNTNTNGRNA